MATIDFVEWLYEELRKREWKPADLARKAGTSKSVISRVLNRERVPSPETLDIIAHALGLPPETVYRAAGLLPPLTPTMEDTEEVLYLLAQLPPEERQEIIEFMRLKLDRKKKKPPDKKPDGHKRETPKETGHPVSGA
jgi:transcriptional regulator with XRE-family HTH domain